MKNFFTKNGIILLTAVTVIAVLLCVVSAASSGTGFIHNAVGVIVSPFRAVGSTVSGWVTGIGDHFADLEKLQQENDELRQQVAELERQLRQAEEDSKENERLRAYRDSFVILSQPEGAEGISSTAVREGLRGGKDVRQWLHEGVYRIMEEYEHAEQ